jgi:hypothetical protein
LEREGVTEQDMRGGMLEPMRLLPPSPGQGYVGIAEALVPAIEILAGSPHRPAVALSLLCGHAIECALKASLVHRGVPDATLTKSPLNHDLVRLWQKALEQSCPGIGSTPEWLEQLAGVFGRPYRLRYAKDVHGLVLPATSPMVTDVVSICSTLRANCGA